jgi:hypothetical protein
VVENPKFFGQRSQVSTNSNGYNRASNNGAARHIPAASAAWLRAFGMRSVILGVLLLTANVAHARATLVLGSGHNSCGRLIAAIGDIPPGEYLVLEKPGAPSLLREYTGYQEWLMGFVSGFNSSHADHLELQVKGFDLAGMDLQLV